MSTTTTAPTTTMATATSTTELQLSQLPQSARCQKVLSALMTSGCWFTYTGDENYIPIEWNATFSPSRPKVSVVTNLTKSTEDEVTNQVKSLLKTWFTTFAELTPNEKLSVQFRAPGKEYGDLYLCNPSKISDELGDTYKATLCWIPDTSLRVPTIQPLHE